MSNTISMVHTSGYNIILSSIPEDQVNKKYSHQIFEDPAIKVTPHIMDNKLQALRSIFFDIFDDSISILNNDTHILVFKYTNLRFEGYFVGKLLKRVEVTKKNSTTLSVDDSNVVKVKKIASGIKTVIEFKPVIDIS